MRRGDVRAALLVLLEEEPRSGYALMQEIERRSDGVWSPSPGSVYPALQQLEDEGLVHTAEAAGRKAYDLTEEGRAYLEEHRAELGIPWEGLGDDAGDEIRDLMELIRPIGGALMQRRRRCSRRRAGRSTGSCPRRTRTPEPSHGGRTRPGAAAGGVRAR
jgi:DNA-binding PadR family transcriptional regulator